MILYKVSVPVINSNLKQLGREKILEQIKRFDAERVFISLDNLELDDEKRKKSLEELKDNCAFFKKEGFEVGSWNWTFWVKNNKTFRNMRSINGKEISNFMCPSDEAYVKFVSEYVKDIAACSVDLIQLDDDFRYAFLEGSTCCLCDGHIALINELTGDNSTREELEKYITTGGKNKYRDAYLKANGDCFRKFAKAIRSAVDEVDPTIRISVCSCMSSWDIDGTDAYELATILAGNTKPLVRLIGAPYWAVKKNWGNSLQDVIELERMESSWTRKGEIEIMAEGDCYPRPRSSCPASFLEGFDTAIRVSGCTDGIIKYGIDYFSNPDYETGYAKYHEDNRELYREIYNAFSEKTSVGVRVYESMKKVSDMVMPTKVNSNVDISSLFFSKAARVLAYNTIPTTYEGQGVCGIVFDENARNLPLSALDNGLILDIAAAEILAVRGVDVGIEMIGEKTAGEVETFKKDGNKILATGSIVYDIKLNKGAEILSEISTSLGDLPFAVRYENDDKNRFLILNINTRMGSDHVLKHYAVSKQLSEQIEWLGGRKLPAYVYGNPAMYIQCKENGNSLAVGLWNFFADTAFSPEVHFERTYSSIKFINCAGRLEKNKVYLSDIAPYGFAGFEVMQ